MSAHLINNFRTYVEEIDDYRRYLTTAARLTETQVTEDIGSLRAHIDEMSAALTPGLRKRLNYSSVVVALYGVVEDFVERLIEYCVDVISASVRRYRDLPAAMRKNHERLSVKLAEQLGQPGYRRHLNLRTVIENLHGCLADQLEFRLNRDAFSMHTANLRHDVVRDMFAAASIPNIDQAVVSHPLTRELLTELGRSHGEARFYIDDLADRRNVVAHGERPHDVISVQTMSEYIRAARIFGEALYESALLGVCEIALPRAAVPMGKPTATYRSGRIVCLSPDVSAEVYIGDRVLWRTQERWRMARINSLQVDRQDLETVYCQPGSRLGIGVSSSGSSSAEYWVLRGW
jgi:hypothetical protein